MGRVVFDAGRGEALGILLGARKRIVGESGIGSDEDIVTNPQPSHNCTPDQGSLDAAAHVDAPGGGNVRRAAQTVAISEAVKCAKHGSVRMRPAACRAVDRSPTPIGSPWADGWSQSSSGCWCSVVVPRALGGASRDQCPIDR